LETEFRAVLIHVIDAKRKEIRDEYLEEFRLLVSTLSYEIIAETTYMVREPQLCNFLGKGKIEEIQKLVELTEADIVFIDTTLTFLQLKNLSKRN